MFIKLDFLEPKKRLKLRQISIKIALKTAKFVKNNNFLALFMIILSIYLIRRFDLYIRHLMLRRKSDFVKDFIPHGEIKQFSNKNILLWNGKNSEIYHEDLSSINCPVSNCVFTKNRGLLPTIADYDGIIFNIDESSDVDLFPDVRDSRQIYILGIQRYVRKVPLMTFKCQFPSSFSFQKLIRP